MEANLVIKYDNKENFFGKCIFKIFTFVCVSRACMHAHAHTCMPFVYAHRAQKRALYVLKLKLQAFASHPTKVLGTKLGLFVKIKSAPNY